MSGRLDEITAIAQKLVDARREGDDLRSQLDGAISLAESLRAEIEKADAAARESYEHIKACFEEQGEPVALKRRG